MAPPESTGSLAQQLPAPMVGTLTPVDEMRSGCQHRYSAVSGDAAQTAVLGREYAGWQGARPCPALASGGNAMQIALRPAGGVPKGAVAGLRPKGAA